MKRNKCNLYPRPEKSEQICAAGADVYGLGNDNYICSEEYSENCPWFREFHREMIEEEIGRKE